MKKIRILIADDEQRILKFLKLKLHSLGYEVLTANSGLEVLEILKDEPDLIVLDVMMPEMDGFETLEKLRTQSSVPVIILSARETNADKITGLGLGADDYLAKPFNPDELVARIEAVLRRMAPDEERILVDSISLGNVNINLKNHDVTVGGQEIKLTRIEWMLLGELARNSGKLIPYSDLLSKIWGPEYRDDIQILRTWVSRLRQKIEKGNSTVIRTIPKIGYMIDQETK